MAIEPIKGFYVHDEATDTDGVAKVSIEAVQEFEDDIRDETSNWLDEHPEASTTVLPDSLTTDKYKDESVTTSKLADGAVTEDKLALASVVEGKVNVNFLAEIKNAYVVPEQFGAVGDGVDDDAEAIQSAVNSLFPVMFDNGKTYLVAGDLTLLNGSVLLSEFENNYSGNAFNIILHSATIRITDRKTTIKNISIKSYSNTETAFTFTNENITDVAFDNILLNGFETCFFSEKETSYMWRMIFGRVHTIDCATVIDYSTQYNTFNIDFRDCYFDGMVKLSGANATFSNCNFGLNVENSLYLKQCYCLFMGCNFENDIKISSTSIRFEQSRCNFSNCIFYAWQTSGTFFFTQKSPSYIVFDNCEVKTKSGNEGTWWKNTGEEFSKYGNVCAWNTNSAILPAYTYSSYSNSGLVFGTVPVFANIAEIITSRLYKGQSFVVLNIGLCYYDGTNICKYDGTAT